MVECGHFRSLFAIRRVYIDAVRDPAAFASEWHDRGRNSRRRADVEAIFVPFGGGGLACGIANALRAAGSAVKVSLRAGRRASSQAARAGGGPVESPCDPGFVTGVGFGAVPARDVAGSRAGSIDDILTVSLSEVVDAIRLLAAGNKVVAEGAGAIPVAAALSNRHRFRSVCAVVSGGNLDPALLAKILRGEDLR